MSESFGDRRKPENISERREFENMTGDDAPIRRWLLLGRRALNYFSHSEKAEHSGDTESAAGRQDPKDSHD